MRFGDQRTEGEKILDELKDSRRESDSRAYRDKLDGMSARELKYLSEPSLALYKTTINNLIKQEEYSLEEAEELMFTEWALGPDDSETPKEKRYHELRIKIAGEYRESLQESSLRLEASEAKSKCKKLVIEYQKEGLDLEQSFRKLHQGSLDAADDLQIAFASKMISAIELARSDIKYKELMSHFDQLSLSTGERLWVMRSYRLKTALAIYSGLAVFSILFLLMLFDLLF